MVRAALSSSLVSLVLPLLLLRLLPLLLLLLRRKYLLRLLQASGLLATQAEEIK